MSRRSLLLAGLLVLVWIAPAFAQDTQTVPQETFQAVPEPAIDGELPQPRREAEREPEQTPTPVVEGETNITPSSTATTPPPAWWSELRRDLNTQAAAEGEAAAQPAPPPVQESVFSRVLRTVAWLCVLCGLIVLGGYLLRRYGKNTPLLAGAQYGTVLGKVHLSPRASLHYVQSGGRILVIGLTQQHMSLIAEFEPGSFELPEEAEFAGDAPATPGSFVEELRLASRPQPPVVAEDDELTALRGDVQRLQRYLQDNLRESAD